VTSMVRSSAVTLAFGIHRLGIGGPGAVCPRPLWYAWQGTIREGARGKYCRRMLNGLSDVYRRDGRRGPSGISSMARLAYADRRRTVSSCSPTRRVVRLAGNLEAWPNVPTVGLATTAFKST